MFGHGSLSICSCMDGVHAFSSDQGIFLGVFLTPNTKICITRSFLELFFMIKRPWVCNS